MIRSLHGALRTSALSTVVVLVGVTSALAARPDTRTLTCAQAQDLVQRSGAIVLSTGDHTYSRFVANRGFCGHYEITRPQYAPTRDAEQCPVASRCERVVRPRNN